jgi:putative PIN family toxin of toxin-antitoxin system
MTADPTRRVVYDCNILFQALISKKGPAHRRKEIVEEGRAVLFVSDYVFEEVRDISSRPALRAKFALEESQVEAFLADVARLAVHVTQVPDSYRHPSDPKDSHYVNLALVAAAELIVSRDRHLLDLCDPGRPAGRDFTARFPQLRILEPTAFLREIESSRA